MNQPQQTNIVIADDHTVICKGIESIVAPAFKTPIFTYANSLDQLKTTLQGNTYHLLLLDVNYSDGSLVNSIQHIKEQAPQSKIIVFTSGLSYQEFKTIKPYVNAILNKNTPPNTFLNTIEQVIQNNTFVCSPIDNQKIQKLETLSDRELEVLNCMLQGLGNKEMVYQLNIKESTISTLRKRILEKLNLTNNVDMLNYFTASII